jgi:hypothetical protein
MTELARLRAPDITGEVLTPEDHGYDAARAVFAAHVDARPARSPASAAPTTSRDSSRTPVRPGPSSRSVAAATAPRATASATAAS